jgi:hypothetical protein
MFLEGLLGPWDTFQVLSLGPHLDQGLCSLFPFCKATSYPLLLTPQGC